MKILLDLPQEMADFLTQYAQDTGQPRNKLMTGILTDRSTTHYDVAQELHMKLLREQRTTFKSLQIKDEPTKEDKERDRQEVSAKKIADREQVPVPATSGQPQQPDGKEVNAAPEQDINHVHGPDLKESGSHVRVIQQEADVHLRRAEPEPEESGEADDSPWQG